MSSRVQAADAVHGRRVAETDKVVVRDLNFYYGAGACAQRRFAAPVRRAR